MAITNNNVPCLHRKEWQTMNQFITSSSAGALVTTDVKERKDYAMVFAASQFIYSHNEDSIMLLNTASLAGTFGAGTCGTTIRWSSTITTNGGSTTTATTTTVITQYAVGETIRFLSGANIGVEATITEVIVNQGGTNTIRFAAIGSVVSSGDTFAVSTGRVLLMNAGTIAAGIFKSYDYITGVWTTLSTTGLPATWATDGRLVCTPSDDIFATGTATAGSGTTITNSAKTWTTNQWTNYQITITAGTGIGQTRTISSNTGTVITVPTWTTTPDATSVYKITGNDDFVYLLGNGAVTIYRYTISTNTWATMAPTTARGGGFGTGGGANWIGKTGDTNWANESDIKDGRYIFSFRGSGLSNIDRFDIAGGTAGAGAWLALSYVGAGESYTSGSAYAASGTKIYARKDGTGRFMQYDVTSNEMIPFTINGFTDGAGVVGDKVWVHVIQDAGVDKVKFLYSQIHSSTVIHRILII